MFKFFRKLPSYAFADLPKLRELNLKSNKGLRALRARSLDLNTTLDSPKEKEDPFVVTINLESCDLRFEQLSPDTFGATANRPFISELKLRVRREKLLFFLSFPSNI